MVISHIQGREILDSRGVPALQVELTLENKFSALASVPSGASTGSYEAWELRDQDPSRFHGKGLLKAISTIEKLSKELKTRTFKNQADLDTFLNKLDGTKNKSRLGANTLLAISLAYAYAVALSQGQELFESFNFFKESDKKSDKESNKKSAVYLPVPLINILNGGVHAHNGLDVQEFMIVPYGFASFKEALRGSSEVFHTLRQLLKKENLSVAVGDEGGFAPVLSENESALKLLTTSIQKAGYENQIALALDVAASEFYREGFYQWEKEKLKPEDLISIYKDWSARYPLISIEDGLAEEDWEGWTQLTKVLGQKVQLLGDDLFVTHIDRLKEGVKRKVANALLAKPNQVGTLTETQDCIQLAKQEGYNCCLSHRSGETEDTAIADLSVAWGVRQIKAGSVCRGERVAKYNRLLKIEEKLKSQAFFAGQEAFSFLKPV